MRSSSSNDAAGRGITGWACDSMGSAALCAMSHGAKEGRANRAGHAKSPPARGGRALQDRLSRSSTATGPRLGAGTSTSLYSEEPGVAPVPPEPAGPEPPGAAWVRREPQRGPALVEPLIPFNQPGRDGATCPSSRPWCGPRARRGPRARSRAWWPRNCTAGSWRRRRLPSG